jgi:hypothetical protein
MVMVIVMMVVVFNNALQLPNTVTSVFSYSSSSLPEYRHAYLFLFRFCDWIYFFHLLFTLKTYAQ